MPFTFSHPAIVLPLTYLPRRWYSLTGLVMGSLTPDFEYFIRMKVQSDYSHTLAGLLWFDLPLGLLLAFVYHCLVRDALLRSLPTALQSRLVHFSQFNWLSYFKAHWIVVAFSVLIGAASHLLWDSFTHKSGYFVSAIPELKSSLSFRYGNIPVYKLLQHASSLLGSITIVLTLWSLPKHHRVSSSTNYTYWAFLVLIAMSIIALRIVSGLSYQQYGNLVATGISAGIIGMILTPLITKPKNKSC